MKAKVTMTIPAQIIVWDIENFDPAKGFSWFEKSMEENTLNKLEIAQTEIETPAFVVTLDRNGELISFTPLKADHVEG